MNTAEFLQITAMVVPERDALVCGDKRVTFEQMADRVNRLANWLQSAGAGPDNPVGAVSTNGIEYVQTYYAAAKIGATFVR
jgi:acyl-CoA synthetase (AMP-forming)/AMP-acid ligase II